MRSIPGLLLSILVLGIAVPAFVIASKNSRDSVPEAGIAHLTASRSSAASCSASAAATATR